MAESSAAKIQELFQKVPPNNPDAERGTLGAILLDNNMLHRAMEMLDAGDFYEARNRMIYEAMLQLSEHGEPIDLVTLTNELRRSEKLEKVGGVTYVSALTEAAPIASRIETYARIVREKNLLRSLISISQEIAARAYEDPAEVEEFMDEAEAAIFDVAGKKISPSYYSLHDLVPEAVRQLEALQKRKGGITGVPTGYKDLDELTGGFQPSDFVVIAGRPGMGKTALALNIARNAAVTSSEESERTGDAVAVFSLEMSRWQVALRLFCAEARLDSRDLRRGFIAKEDWPKLFIAANVLKEARIFVDDTPALNVLEMKAKTRRLVAEHKVSMVIVDYMQLMRGRQTRDSSREQEIADISRSLKNLAKELNIPVVGLSQLNRAVESREDKRPRLADLRESGAIEQDADLILFLYREKKYKSDTPVGNMTEVIVGKHRNGPEGMVKLTFLEEFARFENHSPIDDIPDFGE